MARLPIVINYGTTADRNASSPTEGYVWYDTDLGQLMRYNGATWDSIEGTAIAPGGAAGGDLSGTYPDPDVVDDSHAHTASTLTLAHADLDTVTADQHHDKAHNHTTGDGSGVLTNDEHDGYSDYAEIAAPAAPAANNARLYSRDDGGTTKVYYKRSDNTEVEVAGTGALHDPVTLDADAAVLLDLSTQEIGLDVQNANKVFAGPSTGADDEPTFRALVQADLPAQVTTINIVLDGGGSAISTGIKLDLVIDFACTLLAWTLLADQSGAIKIDLWRDTYANYPPTDADSLTNAHEPEIPASGTKAQDTDLSDWTSVAIVAGDTLRVNVDSCTTITRCTLALKAQRS